MVGGVVGRVLSKSLTKAHRKASGVFRGTRDHKIVEKKLRLSGSIG